MNDEDIIQPVEPIPVEESAYGDGEPVKGADPVAPTVHEDEVPDQTASS